MSKKKSFLIPRRFSRRGFLVGASGITLGLPFLESFFGQEAHAAETPRNFITFSHFNGTRTDATAREVNGELSLRRIYQPLERHKAKLLCIHGVSNKQRYMARVWDGHRPTIGTFLTGAPPASAFNNGNYLAVSDQREMDHNTPPSQASIDQYIGEALKENGQRSCVRLAVGQMYERFSAEAAGTWSDFESSPERAFADLFASVVEGDGADQGPSEELLAIQALHARRRSVLDAVYKNANSLGNELSASDKIRLEEHMSLLRDLEQEVTAAPPMMMEGGLACMKPSINPSGGFDPRSFTSMEESARLQGRIAAAALRCNVTRSVSVAMAGGGDSLNFLGLHGGLPNYHELAHSSNESNWRDPAAVAFSYYADRFAALLDALDEFGIADQTLSMWVTDLGDPTDHQTWNIPVVFAGNMGDVAMGRYVDLARDSSPELYTGWGTYALNNAYVSALNAFGIQESTFGFQPTTNDITSGILPNWGGNKQMITHGSTPPMEALVVPDGGLPL